MADKLQKPVPKPSLRRMPVYLRCLSQLDLQETEWVSCTYLAEELRLDPTLVRKDLSLTGIVGKPKVGYPVAELIRSIEHFIGWDIKADAFLVGVGSLGTALLGYGGFQGHGLNIILGFDYDPAKIGTRIHGTSILNVEELPPLVQQTGVQIGIIAVGASSAQSVADLMVLSGIRGIWNFAPAHLQVPDGVIVENEDLSASLAVLSRRLARVNRQRSRPRSRR